MISTEEQKRLDEELLRECKGYHARQDKPDGAYIEEGVCFFNINKIKRLIEAGANVNAKNEFGYTPLHRTWWSVTIVKLLISAGADVNAKDRYDESPLAMAVYWDDVAIAKLLISAGADVNAKLHGGRLPLDYAVLKCKKKMQALLKQHGATK